MESEHHYELRSRSRSRSQTPRVPSKTVAELELTEHHYDLRSRSRERSHTPGEVSSSRRSGSRSLTGSVTKRQDRSMETISERKEEPAVVADITAEAQNRQNESAASSAPKRVERRSERRRVKRQIFANGQSESKDESVDEKADESPTPRRVLTSDYSSEEGEREDSSRPGSAYEIYKQAGDWWNVFPKTDYTYSQKSQCRYEIAPGVLAMPNMSRRSIHSDSNSTTSSIPSTSQQNIDLSAQMTEDNFGKNNMDPGEITETSHADLTPVERDLFEHTRLADSITRARVYKTTHFEQFKSHREVIYTDSGNSSPIESRQERYSTWTDFPSSAFVSRKFGRVSQIDSDTELDEAMTLTSTSWKKKWNMRSWFKRLTVTIVMWYTSMVEFIGLRQSQVQRNLYTPSHDYRRYHESRWSKLWRFIDHALQYLYLLLVRILYLDSWLLSRASFVRERMQQRRSKILWITLLPLVLLAGAYVAQKHTFTYLDSLRDVRFGVAETTYRILNDTTDLLAFDYSLLTKYVSSFRNLSLPRIPSLNISLPTLPSANWNVTW